MLLSLHAPSRPKKVLCTHARNAGMKFKTKDADDVSAVLTASIEWKGIVDQASRREYA